MARRKRPKPGLLANRSNRSLTPLQEELVCQTHAACGSINATVKTLGINYRTVQKVLQKAENDLRLQTARGRALEELAGKATEQAERILGSIDDDELQSRTLDTFHPNGRFAKVQEVGPGLVGKTRAFGVLADKIALLQQARRSTLPVNHDDTGYGNESGLLLPQSIEETRRLIAQKVRRLRIVDVEFDKGETGQRVSELTRRANLTSQDIEEADYVPLGAKADPFD